MGLVRKGCARALEGARYTKRLNEQEIGRVLFSEIMETIKRGRVPLRSARLALDLCERELDDLQERDDCMGTNG
jgi:hypothetical protein